MCIHASDFLLRSNHLFLLSYWSPLSSLQLAVSLHKEISSLRQIGSDLRRRTAVPFKSPGRESNRRLLSIAVTRQNHCLVFLLYSYENYNEQHMVPQLLLPGYQCFWVPWVSGYEAMARKRGKISDCQDQRKSPGGRNSQV